MSDDTQYDVEPEDTINQLAIEVQMDIIPPGISELTIEEFGKMDACDQAILAYKRDCESIPMGPALELFNKAVAEVVEHDREQFEDYTAFNPYTTHIETVFGESAGEVPSLN